MRPFFNCKLLHIVRKTKNTAINSLILYLLASEVVEVKSGLLRGIHFKIQHILNLQNSGCFIYRLVLLVSIICFSFFGFQEELDLILFKGK